MSRAPPGITLVAIITVRATALDQFRAFERYAAAVMKRHGGRIERTVVVAVPESPDIVKEIHVVTFASEAAFAAYRGDPGLGEFAALREASVVRTEVLIGTDGPDYGCP
ncbi:MAG: hypothetical protein ABI790_11655 [Betaproteobacteria bacterium]